MRNKRPSRSDAASVLLCNGVENELSVRLNGRCFAMPGQCTLNSGTKMTYILKICSVEGSDSHFTLELEIDLLVCCSLLRLGAKRGAFHKRACLGRTDEGNIGGSGVIGVK